MFDVPFWMSSAIKVLGDRNCAFFAVNDRGAAGMAAGPPLNLFYLVRNNNRHKNVWAG